VKRAMKVGLIVECAPKGIEDVVCRKILNLLAAECKVSIDCVISTMINKKLLLDGCAATARTLLNDGCDRVVILWDEDSPWTPEKDRSDKRCWRHERDGILAQIETERIPMDKVGLVCIEHEFETIMLYDTELLRSVVSAGKEHPAKIKKIKNPLSFDNPTVALRKLFRTHKSRYNKAEVSSKFAMYLNGLDALQRCDSFRRLVEKILGEMPPGWRPYIYVPRGPSR
jgi:hypothetical protein